MAKKVPPEPKKDATLAVHKTSRAHGAMSEDDIKAGEKAITARYVEANKEALEEAERDPATARTDFSVDERELELFMTPERIAALEQSGVSPRAMIAVRAYLASLAERGLTTFACRDAGVGLSMTQAWRTKYDIFREMELEARKHAAERLEAAAVRRARDGVLKPVWQKGEFCGYERVYSDTLMVELLRAADPERFARKTKTELTGPGGGPIQIEPVITDLLSRVRRLRRAAETPEPVFDGTAADPDAEADHTAITRSRFDEEGEGGLPDEEPPASE